MPTTIWEGVCATCGRPGRMIGMCVICGQPACPNCGGEAEGKTIGGWVVVHKGDHAMTASNQGLIFSPWPEDWR